MNNNEILNRLSGTLNLNSDNIAKVFSLAELSVTNEQVVQWLEKEESDAFIELKNIELASFLNGLIAFKRGKREGEQPKPEWKLSNNIIFQKLRIALNLQTTDIIDILQLAGSTITKHELSALFRKPGNKHYRSCKDQTLSDFLAGLELKFRHSDNK